MKKIFYLLLIISSVLPGLSLLAQFKDVPSVVTDSFKAKYPQATNVKWSAGLSAATAKFTMGGDQYTARYTNKGDWENSTRKISQEALPTAVKDGLAKSKYSGKEWKVREVTEHFKPGKSNQYEINVAKSDLKQQNLTFDSNGKLLKNSATL